ncbi:ABC transporter permease [Naasia lichenicola]|uniref:ABC transporter permease n=1 Tax=Naasia lichenicola TaxID=2565933 RepID=A0A4S4FH79_9MICO|nr:hypothetical protein [Naasia lichenicola]THG29328.1 hypothetical protein E6C64_11445 [Naasia lichenicola]
MSTLTTHRTPVDLDIRPPKRFAKIRAFYGGSSLGAVVTAALLVAVISLIVAGPDFYSVDNFGILTSYIAVPLVMSAFACVGLLAGIVDLSVGPMVGVSAAIFAALGPQLGFWPGAAIAVLVALAAAAINALAVVRFRADSIAATVGMLTILSGITLAVIGSNPPTYIVDGLFAFSLGALGPFSYLFLIAVAVILAVAGFVTFHKVGRHLRAAGGDENAATRAGIKVGRLRVFAFLFGGLGAGIAGILYIGQNGGPALEIGPSLTFQSYAALMIGGFSLVRGGVGNPIGGLFGLLIIGAVGVLLDLQQINNHFLDVVLGSALIVAVLVDRLRGGDRFE